MCTNCAFAIDCYSDRGPSFGGGLLTLKFCLVQTITKHYPKGTEKANSILAGSHHFQTLEIEVFVRTI